MKSSITFSLFVLILSWAGCLPARTFTDTSGRKVEAEISEVTGDSVILQLPNGSKSTVPLTKLSAADLLYIGGWQKENSAQKAPARAATFTPTGAAPAPVPPPAVETPVKAAGEPALPAGHKFRLKAVVNPVKKSKGNNNYYYENKEVRSTLKVDIRNEEINYPLNKGKARLVSFSRDLNDKSSLAVMHCEDYDLNLKPGETFSKETEEVKLQFYNSSDYKYGHKYYGHLLIVQHEGKTLLVETSQPALADHAENVWKLSKEQAVNPKLEAAK